MLMGKGRFICDHCGRDRDTLFLMDFRELLDDPRADQVNICLACHKKPQTEAYWRGWLDSKFGTPYDHFVVDDL